MSVSYERKVISSSQIFLLSGLLYGNFSTAGFIASNYWDNRIIVLKNVWKEDAVALLRCHPGFVWRV
jgi:hypothetical protein